MTTHKPHDSESLPDAARARPVPPAAAIPELLAPAGDWECARAAVENGADAIYFGLERFNARMRADNFTEADLPKLMEFLHRRGVKGYVTFNTLIFSNEIEEAGRTLRAIIAAGVDAVIVQDVGLCRLIRGLSADFPIHASTQMTITSAAGVGFARKLGCQLVVLARECSLTEIGQIRAAESVSAGAGELSSVAGGLPIEVFVHGALCVAYSGQCLTSEALGGRSANRGECAQACRMPYELVSDGRTVPLGDRRYLLSPQDLSGLEVLPELVRAGVASLKIEGRLKSPEYVANITRVYRRALDGISDGDKADSARPFGVGSRYDVEMAFSRGLSTGWFRGINNQELVHARFGKKRGVYLGEVARVSSERVFLKLEGPLKPGDGVVFDAGKPDETEQGGRVYEVTEATRVGSAPPRGARPGGSPPPAGETMIAFGNGEIDFSRVRPGDKLWKTSDPELDRRLRQTFAGDDPRFQRPIDLEIHGCVGQPMTVIARDESGNVARAASRMPLEAARTQPLDAARLREQFGRLGGTPFKLGQVANHLEGTPILPMSELNRLRRELVAGLEALRAAPKRWSLNAAFERRSVLPPEPGVTADASSAGTRAPALIVLVRNLEQLDAALQCGVQTVYCEFEDVKKYREAVALARTARGCDAPAVEVFVAPPRIFKMGEDWILQQVRSSNADGWLVRNHDHLAHFAGERCVGDFSLNVANELTAEYFKRGFALERVTASYDLNIVQLEALLRSAPPDWFEITIHQHMPMFHMEHCVFCAFLSDGTDFRNCGRPCDKHGVALRDRVGAEHPLRADAGCRNTVFNALAQTGAEHIVHLLALGVRHFRIEFVGETREQAARTIGMYRQLLRGEITGAQLWRELKLVNQLGVTRGQMATL
jgi:putative protease